MANGGAAAPAVTPCGPPSLGASRGLGRDRQARRSRGRGGFSANHPGQVGSFVDGRLFGEDASNLTLTLGASDGVLVHGTIGLGKPAPDAYVALSMVSAHDADVFAVPVAADGTFEATLPRGEPYKAQIIEGGAGGGVATRSGDRVELAVTLVALGPPPQEVVDWIGAHAIALATTEAGHGFDDIAPIAPLIGDARIVGLGEATHGTCEFFQLKHRVVEYLVARQGFTVFAIEANQPECRALNDYVLHGTGDPRVGLDGISFWMWNTQEVLAMFEWMRAWNANPEHHNKIQFTGFDMQMSSIAYTSVAAYLTKVAPATCRSRRCDETATSRFSDRRQRARAYSSPVDRSCLPLHGGRADARVSCAVRSIRAFKRAQS